MGCGVFGLGSLLVGVALVVWLGSTALDGSGGPPGGSDGTTTAVERSAVAGLAVDAPADLGDGGTVTLTGTAHPLDALAVDLCLAHPPEAASGPDGACDAGTASDAVAGPDGALSVARTVPRVITATGTAYDCAAAPGACVVRVRIAGDGGPGTTAPLAFATGLPPVDAVAPPSG